MIDTGPNGKWSESILAKGALCAPELIRVEACNILRRLERAKKITSAEANASYGDVMQLDIELYLFEPFAHRTWQLRHVATTYDAWYVAVAEALEVPLATLDLRLAKTKGAGCRFLTPQPN